jgi:hypothetical protein
MFSPALGQYISRDPLGFDAGDVNARRYVGNGPVDGLDPLGLEPVICKNSYDLRYPQDGDDVSKLMVDRRGVFALDQRSKLTVILIADYKASPDWEPTAKSTYSKSVIWKRVASADDVAAILTMSPDGSIDKLVIGGHGSNTGIRLGTPKDGIIHGGFQDRGVFEFSTIVKDQKLRNLIRSKMSRKSLLELQGCNTGHPKGVRNE